jgi:hypothetical protein
MSLVVFFVLLQLLVMFLFNGVAGSCRQVDRVTSLWSVSTSHPASYLYAKLEDSVALALIQPSFFTLVSLEEILISKFSIKLEGLC